MSKKRTITIVRSLEDSLAHMRPGRRSLKAAVVASSDVALGQPVGVSVVATMKGS